MGAAQRSAIACAALLVGCGGAGEPPTDEGVGEQRERPQVCGFGERVLSDGSCQAPGVPREACAPGFESDEDGGCVAVLPEERCDFGTTASLGDTACRPLASCGSQRYPQLSSADLSLAQYVDAAFVGTSDGSAQSPWQTIQEGVNAAASGAVVAVAAGSYFGGVTITGKPVRLWGRCPTLVTVTASEMAPVINVYSDGAGGTEIRGLRASSGRMGVVATDVDSLLIADVWVFDTALYGIYLADDLGKARATVVNVLVQGASGLGIGVLGSELVLSDTMVRETRPATEVAGRGIQVDYGYHGPSVAEIDGCVIDDNFDMGILGRGSALSIRASLIRNTKANAAAELGRGVSMESHASAATSLTMESTVVAGNRDIGVYLSGTTATLSNVVVRDTSSSIAGFGAGVAVQYDADTSLRASLTIVDSLVERSDYLGMLAIGADLEAEGLFVRDTQAGLAGAAGRGITVQHFEPTGEPASGVLRYSAVQGARSFGLAIVGADVKVQAMRIDGVMPRASDGLYGDGIAVAVGRSRATSLRPARMKMDGSEVTGAKRAGVSLFGAMAELEGSRVACNLIDLAGSGLFETVYELQDLGGNRCGCQDGPSTCHVLSSDIEPPAAL